MKFKKIVANLFSSSKYPESKMVTRISLRAWLSDFFYMIMFASLRRTFMDELKGPGLNMNELGEEQTGSS